MKFIKFTTILFLCFITFTCYSQNREENLNTPVTMFKNWLSGIKNQSFEKFKDGYLQDDWDKMTKEKKNQLLNRYSKIFDSEFGDYKIEDFNVSFQGNENEGKLIIFFKEKSLPNLMVKKVNNDWVLAEK
ncbi:hypothetical protein [Marinifilum fragile]|jgi:hypothetical protein|uniref:hypothetical protein n=1 Tax=Marinifilum fragile TaxID=570161 RepID=UPI0012FC49E1|nr:hypothetical protein [Marinifilum fragile]